MIFPALYLIETQGRRKALLSKSRLQFSPAKIISYALLPAVKSWSGCRGSMRSDCRLGRTLHFGPEWYLEGRPYAYEQEGWTSQLDRLPNFQRDCIESLIL